MHRNTWTALVFILALAALVTPPAKADSGNYWNPDQPDESLCQDMTGNWIMCDSMGENGIASGSAPGMNSCTSTKGCLSCVVTLSNPGRMQCATVPFSDGYCKCNDNNGCISSGECKYVGG